MGSLGPACTGHEGMSDSLIFERQNNLPLDANPAAGSNTFFGINTDWPPEDFFALPTDPFGFFAEDIHTRQGDVSLPELGLGGW